MKTPEKNPTAQAATVPIPAGYRKNSQGHLIPENLIRPIDLARDALVVELAGAAKKLNQQIVEFKARIFGDLAAFIQLSAEQYQALVGGKQGNVTLFSYDGRFRIQVATSKSIAFDERLQAAKALVDECIAEWSKDSRPEIMTLVQQAFQTDQEGRINTGSILALRRLKIEDPRWLAAMTAMSESVQVVGSKQYVRLYERVGETDRYDPISLDIAGA